MLPPDKPSTKPSDNHDGKRMILATGNTPAACVEWAVSYLNGTPNGGVIITPSRQTSTRINSDIASNLAPIGNRKAVAISLQALAADINRIHLANNPTRNRVMGVIPRKLALDYLLARTIREGDLFHRSVDTPGFTMALLSRIDAWKLAGATLEGLVAEAARSAAGSTVDTFPHKTGEFIRVFEEYENFLHKNNLMDSTDALRQASLALKSIRTPEYLSSRTIVLAGFNRLAGLEMEIVDALVGMCSSPNVLDPPDGIALTVCLDRNRPVLFGGTAAFVDHLVERFGFVETPIASRKPAADSPEQMATRIFAPRTDRDDLGEIRDVTLTTDTETAAKASVVMLRASDVMAELDLVAEHLRQLRSVHSWRWQEMALVARNMEQYAAAASVVFQQHQIPIWIDSPTPLRKHPMAQCFMGILNIYRSGWSRDACLALFRCSYLGLDPLEVDHARICSRSIQGLKGNEAWLKPARSGTLSQSLREVVEFLAEWEEKLLDPSLPASLRSRNMADLLRDMGVIHRRARRAVSDSLEEGARRQLMSQLGAMRWIEQLFEDSTEFETLNFERYVARLETAIEQTNLRPSSVSIPDAVALIPPGAATDRSYRACILVGMVDGSFPRSTPGDSLFHTGEQDAIATAFGVAPNRHTSESDMERLRFYNVCCAPTNQIAFSYPRSESRRETLPSLFLDEVEAASEGRCAVLSIGKRSGSVEFEPLLLPTEPPALYGDEVRKDFGGGDVVSVDDLASYAACPFQFLVNRRFDIEPNYAEQYDLLKSALLRWSVAQTPTGAVVGTMAPGRSEQLLQAVREATQPDGPVRVALMPVHLGILIRSIERTLAQLSKNEGVGASAVGPLAGSYAFSYGVPAEVESGFGSAGLAHRFSGSGVSAVKPLTLYSEEEARTLQIAGYIDLVTGLKQHSASHRPSRLALRIYKEQYEPFDYGAMRRGESLAMALSILAAEQLLNTPVAEAVACSIMDGRSLRLVRAQFADSPDETRDDSNSLSDGRLQVRIIRRDQFANLMQAATAQALHLADRIRAGDITPAPGDRCRHCSAASICRSQSK